MFPQCVTWQMHCVLFFFFEQISLEWYLSFKSKEKPFLVKAPLRFVFYSTDTKTSVSNQDMQIWDPCLQKESLSFHCFCLRVSIAAVFFPEKTVINLGILGEVSLQILEARHAAALPSSSFLRQPLIISWVSFPTRWMWKAVPVPPYLVSVLF